MKKTLINAVFIFIFTASIASAAVVQELRDEISDRNSQIEDLEKEISRYQKEIDLLGGQAQTLESAVGTLELTDKRLGVDIKSTTQKVNKTSLTIDALAVEIVEKTTSINKQSKALANALRAMHELESRSLVEIVLAHDSFSSFWKSVAMLERFQEGVRSQLALLQDLKKNLTGKKDSSIIEKRNLQSLKNRLAAQKVIVEENKLSKKRLLKDTQNKESNYKTILNERIALREALEREVDEFEARLLVEIDPSQLPETGTGILAWPLENVKVTQYFGDTPFSSKNAQIYNGGGHNGIDLRASVGTPVLASSPGVVLGVADTDKQCYKASYGKWILVGHHNGLATLYAHLSLFEVSEGDTIQAGQVLGYSGNTGYSTGPHLHFAVFAKQAVRVTSEYKSRVCGTQLTLPLSPRNGYLNPLSYLPQ
jgi:murein DD-endopeptidase MepM/ murein hydrolase activator NlpD